MLGLENITLPKILPLGAILFEFLFLLVSIPIEGYVFYKMLKFDKKSSIFYAMAVNILSSVLGWIIFFLLEPILPINIRAELMNYIFFHRLKSVNPQHILVFGACVFIITYFMKFLLLKFLVFLLREDFIQVEDEASTDRRLKWQKNNLVRLQNTNLIRTILIANSLSYSAISIVILMTPKSTN